MYVVDLDVVSEAARIARGDLTAEALMQATLARIDAENPKLNAIVSRVDAADLKTQACAADFAWSKGPMHGLPIAVKDLANMAGLPTSLVSPMFVGKVSMTTDVAEQRMLNAGAIVVGETNTPEFGLG